MENCKKCKHLIARDICCFCDVEGKQIKHPCFMGGDKKCEKYEKCTKSLEVKK